MSGAATGTRVLAEIVLAHELTHALEDQRFGLRLAGAVGDDDAQLAYLALVEGSATALMLRYAQRYFTAEEALGGLLGSAFQDTGDLPPFLEAQLVFPYEGGRAFVEDLVRRGGGSWKLVDVADRFRPPASTEQILHPDAYLRVEQPVRVPLALGSVLGSGWTRAAAGTWGELQTRELLATAGGGGAAAAAQGWGGDRYELWRRPAAGCGSPCRAGDALVMRWRWDTPRDEAQFAPALRAVAAQLSGPGVATARRGGAVTLALAPTRALALRLAQSQPERRKRQYRTRQSASDDRQHQRVAEGPAELGHVLEVHAVDRRRPSSARRGSRPRRRSCRMSSFWRTLTWVRLACSALPSSSRKPSIAADDPQQVVVHVAEVGRAARGRSRRSGPRASRSTAGVSGLDRAVELEHLALELVDALGRVGARRGRRPRARPPGCRPSTPVARPARSRRRRWSTIA